MKLLKQISICLLLLVVCTSMHSAVQKSYSADLDEAVLSYIDAQSGTYTAKVKGGSGEMAGLTKASGAFLTIDNGNGSTHFLMYSSSENGNNSFTIYSNQVNATEMLESNPESEVPSIFTSVTLKVKNGKNKGEYNSKSAKTSKFNPNKMSISGNF